MTPIIFFPILNNKFNALIFTSKIDVLNTNKIISNNFFLQSNTVKKLLNDLFEINLMHKSIIIFCKHGEILYVSK